MIVRSLVNVPYNLVQSQRKLWDGELVKTIRIPGSPWYPGETFRKITENHPMGRPSGSHAFSRDTWVVKKSSMEITKILNPGISSRIGAEGNFKGHRKPYIFVPSKP
jgi:hypothetical protein